VDDAGGRVLYRRAPAKPQRIIEASVDRDLVAMLWNVIVAGTGTSASLSPREAAGKTGTTQNSQDAWFVGFTTDYVTAVWVGNDDNSPTRGVTGGTLPAQIWKAAMQTAEKGLPLKALDRSPPEPPHVEQLLASGVTMSPAIGDDESGAAMARAERPPPEGERESRRSGLGRIFGWIFGDDSEERAPPPPRQ
jgi:penicillin-binding protein 1A